MNGHPGSGNAVFVLPDECGICPLTEPLPAACGRSWEQPSREEGLKREDKVSVPRLRHMRVPQAETERAGVKGRRPFTRTVGSLLGHEHCIDGVNDPIAGRHVGADDLGLVHRDFSVLDD
jgi:hypothetical protein